MSNEHYTDFEESNWQDLAEGFITEHISEWNQYVFEQYEANQPHFRED